MEAVDTLRSSKWNHWKDTLVYSFLTLGGNLAPLWVSVLLILLYKHWEGWTGFFKNGEFYIYSASLLTSTLYLLFFKSTKRNGLIGALLGAALLISAVFFAGVRLKGILSGYDLPINEDLLRYSSFFLFVISAFSFFLTNLYENIRTSPDIPKIAQKGYSDMENNFDHLEERKNGD